MRRGKSEVGSVYPEDDQEHRRFDEGGVSDTGDGSHEKGIYTSTEAGSGGSPDTGY